MSYVKQGNRNLEGGGCRDQNLGGGRTAVLTHRVK